MLSDVSLLQGRATVKGVLPAGLGARLIAQVTLGATSTDDFSRLPPELRFFAGGDRSVRGFGYQSLSPMKSTVPRCLPPTSSTLVVVASSGMSSGSRPAFTSSPRPSAMAWPVRAAQTVNVALSARNSLYHLPLVLAELAPPVSMPSFAIARSGVQRASCGGSNLYVEG